MTTPSPNDITRILNDPDLTDSEKIQAINDLTRPTMNSIDWDDYEHTLMVVEVEKQDPPVHAAMLFPDPDPTSSRINCVLEDGNRRFIDREHLRPISSETRAAVYAGVSFPDNSPETPSSRDADAPGDTHPVIPPSVSPETHSGPVAPEKYYTLDEARKITGYSREYIRRLHKEGYLRCEHRTRDGGNARILHVSHSALIEGGFLDVDGRKGVDLTNASRVLGVSQHTLKRRIEDGEIRAIRTKDPKATWRVVLSPETPPSRDADAPGDTDPVIPSPDTPKTHSGPAPNDSHLRCGEVLEDSDKTLVCMKSPGHPDRHYDRIFRRYWDSEK